LWIVFDKNLLARGYIKLAPNHQIDGGDSYSQTGYLLMTKPLSMVKIYTDGACKPNPGPGAWAALLTYKRHERELSGSDLKTTNNRMEVEAAIQALLALKFPCRVIIYSDSQYLVDGWSKLDTLMRNNWINRSGGDAANKDLWLRLKDAAKPHQVDFIWLRGHNGHRENERVDRLAGKALAALSGSTMYSSEFDIDELSLQHLRSIAKE
jgi:ribonuclease HI